MKVRIAVVWWLINNKKHKSLKEDDRTIKAIMPLISELFPGINYYSITGFQQVMHDCVIPVLKKRYPELLTMPAEKVKSKAMTKIVVALPSKGYEWQDSLKWKIKFEKLLAAS